MSYSFIEARGKVREIHRLGNMELFTVGKCVGYYVGLIVAIYKVKRGKVGVMS